MTLSVFLAIVLVFTFADISINGSIIPADEEFSDLNFHEFDMIWKDVNVTDMKEFLAADHPHSIRQTTEIAELYGYATETHEAVANGYILTLHRITGNSTHRKADGKPAVLLMHGLLCSSIDWVMAGPKRGLAFLLADAGYDVWLGNFRGNKYSRKHETLGSSTKAYWSFSWHEQGVEDLPAMIDYILEKTGNEKILYVGHSQGTTTFFVMASELPEYNDKIEAMFSLAPVTFSKNMFSPLLKYLSKFVKQMKKITDLIGLYEFIPNNKLLGKLTEKICNNNGIPSEVCVNIVFVFTGFNKEQFDMELLPAILSHTPAGASMYQIYHYAQIIKSGHFRKFDYGWFGNLKKYFRFSPPSYKIEKITAPIYLHYSKNDWLVHPTDVQKLHSKLPNVQKLSCVPDDKFNHVDFIWAKDVKTLLYQEIMDVMTKIKNSSRKNSFNKI